MAKSQGRSTDSVYIVLGVVLVGLGIVLLGWQMLANTNLGQYVWPLFFAVPGVLLFVLSLGVDPKRGERLAEIGSALTMAGAILFYQNLTGYWRSWTYAWALVLPTSVGLGQLLYGAIRDLQDLVNKGMRWSMAGGILSAILAVVFEWFIFGDRRLFLGPLGWSVLLIGIGIYVLYRVFRQQSS